MDLAPSEPSEIAVDTATLPRARVLGRRGCRRGWAAAQRTGRRGFRFFSQHRRSSHIVQAEARVQEGPQVGRANTHWTPYRDQLGDPPAAG